MIKVVLSVVVVLMLECITVNTAPSCDPRCTPNKAGMKCLSDNRCLCWWGWTGPHATYIISGSYKNRILADYCTTACHYTHDYRNASCAGIPIPQMCSVPVNKTVPPLPCDSQCGTGTYHSAGKCMSNGRCLCWWGWTGPNACYVDGGAYNNRIIADSCISACHYTHDYRNNRCTNTMPTTKPSTQPPSTGSPTTIPITRGQTSTLKPTTGHPTTVKPTSGAPSCDPRCTPNKGGMKCLSDNRCLCWWGWTGPHATYIISGSYKNRILADYCTTACHYTHDYRNASCASIPTPQMCSVPVNKTVPPLPCDSQCGTGTYHSTGTCMSNGRCLCWWGWTGPNACYVDGGTYNNRIIADSCISACHYTHNYRNNRCTNAMPTTKPSTQPPSTGSPTTIPITRGQTSTLKPTTGHPTSGSPSTGSLTTRNPTTGGLTTGPPTTATANPTTGKPFTGQPFTGQPRTPKPTTRSPTTGGSGNPTTTKQTTGKPSTLKPTTGYPTTAKQTTGNPSTLKPTTGNPTTAKQTTGNPSTLKLTTAKTYQPSTKQQTTTVILPKTTTTMPKQTSTNFPSTQQRTTKGVTSTTAKPTTAQPATTTEKTTTQGLPTTTAKATTTQAATTTEATEPTEPPEPTEPTEPGGLQVRGMPANQNQLQNDVDVGEIKDDDENNNKEEKTFSPTGLVIVMVVLLVCVLLLVGAVWWQYGNGSQFPSLLRGYEPVGDNDANMMMKELSESAPLP